MEYRIVPLKLLHKLHNLTDEDCEVNLRLSIEEAINGPSIQISELKEKSQELAKKQMDESNFYL